MQINQYGIYSALSVSEEKNSGELEKILELAEKLGTINKLEAAKEFLEKTWNVNNKIKRYSLAPSCILETKDTDSMFIVNFACPEQDLTYYYKK